mmetsp:Transcript_40052/g.55871  ORF Transcript_40052/g.55871 Transcript_40052/m.55871 type:complete len:669 (+) Transcript_40052:31-2037(+)
MATLFMSTLLVASAAPRPDRLEVSSPSLPLGWALHTSRPGSLEQYRTVTLSLAPNNPNAKKELADEAIRRATPSSATYGQWLTMEEINERTAPSKNAVDSVTEWVRTAGGSANATRNGAVITISASVEAIEALFSTSVSRIVNAATGQSTMIVGTYSVPSHIAQHVTAVYGLHGLPLPPRNAQAAAPGEPAKVTPTVISQVYGVHGVNVSSAKNKQAVGEFQGQTFAADDLTKFFEKYVPGDTKPEDATISKVVGTNPGHNSGIEAALDVEYIMGVAPGVKTEFWGFEAQDFCSDLKQFASTILSTSDAPFVFSISYGWQGDLSQLNCQPDLVDDVDADLALIAARGISVLISSGDSGSAATSGGGPGPGPSPPQCARAQTGVKYDGDGIRLGGLFTNEPAKCCAAAVTGGYKYWTFVAGALFKPHECLGFHTMTGSSQDPKATSGSSAPPGPPPPGPPGPPPGPPPVPGLKLYASWPASSPWVTAVGATRFINQDATGQSGEMATDQFGSGGGFSSMFTQAPNASWQVDDVKNYLIADASDLPPQGSYDPNGRATPDVSALGEGFQVIVGGAVQSVGGTSASAPTFAAIVSLLNEARFAKGMPALGLLNPWIYKNKDMFYDVTKGSNKISRSGSAFRYGWDCLPGWDPVTGFGTPLFQKMLVAATQA